MVGAGPAAKSARIGNHRGFPHGVSGERLNRLAMVQALTFGVRIHSPCAVARLDLSGEQRPAVPLGDGARIRCRAVIAANWAHYRHLDLPRRTTFERSGCVRNATTELDVRGLEFGPLLVRDGSVWSSDSSARC